MSSGVARLARVVCWIAAVTVVAWAMRSPWLRDADGTLAGIVCLPIACGLSLILAATGIGTRYQQFLWWTAVALVGQAVTLQMIDAGPRIHYQHYEPIGVLWSTRPWLLAWVGAQSVVVGVALARRRRAITNSMRGRIRPWQLAGVAMLSLSTAATVSPVVSRYLSELAFAAYLQLLGIATLVVVAWSFPASQLDQARRGTNRLLGSVDGDSSSGSLRPDRVAWWAAALATIIAAVLSVFSYQRHPHVADEVVYLLHARYLASGMLTMPAPPVPAAFEVDLMQNEPDRWFCPVPPGWPAVLALGAAAGVPWLVNPILGGVNVLLTFMVLLQLYDRRTARLGAVLLALSPWHLFLAMSFMTQTLTLTLALLAVVGVMQARRTGRSRWAFAAGCAIGGVALIRPLDGVIVGAAVGVWAVGAGGRRLRVESLAALGAGTAAIGALTFPYNHYLTGDALRFPINVYLHTHYAPNMNAYGFGPDRGMGWAIDPNPGHGPLDAMINANLNTFSINTDLFGWSTGSLVFMALLLWTWSVRLSDWLMVSMIGLVFVAYFFYYFSGGPDFGARYWFLMIVPLIALTARGIEWLAESPAGDRVPVAVVALSAIAAVNYLPWRAVDKYYHYRRMQPGVRALAKQYPFAGAIVLVRGRQFPDYASAAIENPIDLITSRRPIYAWDRDAATRASTLRAYPDRPVWILDGPSVTNAGYRIVEGPVSAAAVQAQSWTAP